MRSAQELLPAFREAFATEPQVAGYAPGRVNLIGEHTDYNEGFVLPIAIDLGVTLLARARDDRRLRIVAGDRADRCELDLDGRIARSETKPWANYVLGTVALLGERADRPLPGLDLYFSGDVPIGGGLSSSAAVEVATAKAVCEIAGIPMGARDMALLCQRAEHEYAGVKCGIMDQFIATHAQHGQALLLDCRDLSYAMIQIQMPGVASLVVHSGVSHGLHDSEYNARRRQCEEGVRFIAERVPFKVHSLRDLSIDDLLAFHEKMDPVVVTRCRHVITENDRVQRFAEALSAGDAVQCGRLLTASHMSLRQDYEVSCRELNTLVDIANETRGVHGSRMVGAGFGGCVLILVDEERLDAAQASITAQYAERTGLEPTPYRVQAGEGGRAVRL